MRRCLALLAVLLPAAAQADPRWPEYRVMIWSDQKAPGYDALHAVGVDSAKVLGIRTPQIDPAAVQKSTEEVRKSGTPYYVENLATDFYAPYHRWTPEHPGQVTWLMDETRKRGLGDPTSYERQPSLSDDAWIERITARLTETVRLHAPNRPLFYNLGDETGIADLTAAWDFDYGPTSLAAFRTWLRGEYHTLGALNAQWGSSFAKWDDVVPQKTTPALERRDGNFSAWTDFKTFMDLAFAQAIRAGTDAIHAADPSALSAIEGAQVPGRGGYDYTRLPKAVDVMEMYVAAGNLQIARAVNPALIPLSTSFGAGPEEVSRLWREALQGVAGTVVWDDPPMLLPGAVPSDRARGLAPTFNALAGGIGAQFLAARAHYDPVAILYSPVSQHVNWLLDRRSGGAGWAARTSEVEGGIDDAMRRAMGGALSLLQHIAIQPHMLTPESLVAGALEHDGIGMLILPRSLALSDAEVAAIRRFLAAGGKVLADGPPGALDQHGRSRPTQVLPNFPGIPGDPALMTDVLHRAGIDPLLHVTNPDGTPATGVQVYLWRNGGVLLTGIQADYVAGGGQREVVVKLPAARTIQNMRGGGITATDTLPVSLDPAVPTLLALAPAALPKPVIGIVTPGRNARLVVSLSGPSAAAAHIVHIDLLRPDGAPSTGFNMTLTGAALTPTIAFERDDPGGNWTVRATDMMGSGSVEVSLRVPPR